MPQTQQAAQAQRPQPVQSQSQTMVNQGRVMSNSSTPQLAQNQIPSGGMNQHMRAQGSMNTQNAQNMQFQAQQQNIQQQQNMLNQQQMPQIPSAGQTPTIGMSQMSNNNTLAQQQANLAQQKKATGTPQLQTPISQQAHQQQQQPQAQQHQNIQAQQQQTGTGTPQPQGNMMMNRGQNGASASPNTPVTNVNAAAKPNGNTMGTMNTPASTVYKSSVPPLPISGTINPKPLHPATVTQRPSITGGQGLAAPALSTPAILKLPPYEMQSDRVLSKRKLSELVKTVGADEGDGETTIDGDVEELLLDLADEFVTNVTSFACRLAKHRKSDSLDVKDIQLHLEKNWNIRIPGYSSDEIRNVRKWQPNNAHNQRMTSIGVTKSVDQSK